MATSATAFQWPMGTLPPSARKPQVRHAQARVQEVLSRARAISVSSSVCIDRSRACAPADTARRNRSGAEATFARTIVLPDYAMLCAACCCSVVTPMDLQNPRINGHQADPLSSNNIRWLASLHTRQDANSSNAISTRAGGAAQESWDTCNAAVPWLSAPSRPPCSKAPCRRWPIAVTIPERMGYASHPRCGTSSAMWAATVRGTLRSSESGWPLLNTHTLARTWVMAAKCMILRSVDSHGR